jgi:hypothetical protein
MISVSLNPLREADRPLRQPRNATANRARKARTWHRQVSGALIRQTLRRTPRHNCLVVVDQFALCAAKIRQPAGWPRHPSLNPGGSTGAMHYVGLDVRMRTVVDTFLNVCPFDGVHEVTLRGEVLLWNSPIASRWITR